ncbi:hypothetical protein GGR51DRAFT_337254 [Nemania sp. FL0031]|nr:hypothetical protein GGR51DRAFT_337254 [Nemania sp. FL0031]
MIARLSSRTSYILTLSHFQHSGCTAFRAFWRLVFVLLAGMASSDIRYAALPRQEAPDPRRMPTPPPSPFPSPSPTLSPTQTFSDDIGILSLSSRRSSSSTSTAPPSHECISTTELFPALRRGRLLCCGFTYEQNKSITNLLAVIDDVQRRLRTAYAKEREMGGYFQPDAHRQIIREHKIGDWMVVRLAYWEALVAVRGVLGDYYRGVGENGHENEVGMGENGHDDEDTDDDAEMEVDTNVDANGNMAMGVTLDVDRKEEREKDRDKRYDRVVAALKDFAKLFTALKDKALKDKMQVNKQRYTHTGQWLNFLTIGAGVLIYVKNIFMAAPADVIAIVGSGANGTVYAADL